MRLLAVSAIALIALFLIWRAHRVLVRRLDDRYAPIRPSIELSIMLILLAILSYLTAWRYWLDYDPSALIIIASVAMVYAGALLIAWWIGRIG